jgi:hypothetical protein
MRTDWGLVKTAYVTSNKSLTDIAADFKIKERQLKTHSSRENLPEQRKLWRVTTTKQATEKRSSEMATDIAQFDSDSLKLARAGYAMIANEMKSNNPLKSPVHQLATALANFQKVGKLAFGEVSDVDKDITINVKYDDKL